MTYGPDQQRVKRVQTKNGTVQKTKYYGLQYEKEIAGGNTIEINYINSPYGLVAINRKVNSVDTTFYVETDHLGSILALLDGGGNIKEKFSYDTWGRRRNADNWSYNNISGPLRTERGYTGHEHYNVFNIIDMNGRVYDPIIGRFLSPDPIIQSPDFTQSYNSYSYCWNNPLVYIDPSGYSVYYPGDPKCKNGKNKFWRKRDRWERRNNTASGNDDETAVSDNSIYFWDMNNLPAGLDIDGMDIGVDIAGGGYGTGPSGGYYQDFPDIDPAKIALDYVVFDRGHKKLYWHDENCKVIESYPGISGQFGFQKGIFQNEPNQGPIPEGWWYLKISLNPNRIAGIDPATNELWNNNGIELIPYRSPFTEQWGYRRARLIPGKNTMTLGRFNFYIHDSNKLETIGCIETSPLFFIRLLDYRKRHPEKIWFGVLVTN